MGCCPHTKTDRDDATRENTPSASYLRFLMPSTGETFVSTERAVHVELISEFGSEILKTRT